MPAKPSRNDAKTTKKPAAKKTQTHDSEVLKRLDNIEARLQSLAEVTAHFANAMISLDKNMQAILGNQGAFYQKFLLTRLNLIELSEGKHISVSANEQRELENSKNIPPIKGIATLPTLSHSGGGKKRWSH